MAQMTSVTDSLPVVPVAMRCRTEIAGMNGEHLRRTTPDGQEQQGTELMRIHFFVRSASPVQLGSEEKEYQSDGWKRSRTLANFAHIQ